MMAIWAGAVSDKLNERLFLDANQPGILLLSFTFFKDNFNDIDPNVYRPYLVI